MYGTVARLRLKPGVEEQLDQLWRDVEARKVPGFMFQHTYRMDSDPREHFLVVAFENKEAYLANANSPEQHQMYLRFRALLETDPEWHDGEIRYSRQA